MSNRNLRDPMHMVSPNSVNPRFFTISRTNGGTTDREKSQKGNAEAECAQIVSSCQKMGRTWRKFSNRYNNLKSRRDKSFLGLKMKVDRNMKFNNDMRVDYRQDKGLMDLLSKY